MSPTTAILVIFWNSIVAYTQHRLPLSQLFGRPDLNYAQGWTAYYCAWRISWSPFVGMFIARVSRGRTVREFMICVLLIPSLVCMLWMSVFGGTAITQFVSDGVTAVSDARIELKLFEMLKEPPLASITSFFGIILVVVYFVTSSDAGSLVIDTITAGGKIDAPLPQRVFWCCFKGAVAIVPVLGGGLAAVLSTGLPFALILLVMCRAVFKRAGTGTSAGRDPHRCRSRATMASGPLDQGGHVALISIRNARLRTYARLGGIAVNAPQRGPAGSNRSH